MSKRPVLPTWLWLWFPPVMAIVIIASRLAAPDFFNRYIEGEHALVELATPVVALWGMCAGLLMIKRLSSIPSRLVRLWVLLVTLGCLYLAGEELSWGQQLFQWKTPEAVAELNDQQETNLHNMSSWLDQKPRLLLELWVLIGGIIMPLQRRLRAHAPRTIFAKWFWPGIDCFPTAVLAIAIKLPERYRDIAGPDALPFEIRWSEPQEYYFALFLVLYLLSIRARLKARTD